MTSVLVVNAGSSSLKLRVLGPADEVTAALDIGAWDGNPDHPDLGTSLPDGSGDMREVRAAASAGSKAARLAIDVHTHRLRREIAAMAAAMNGLDAVVFTGGIGEHDPQVRAEAAAGLGFLGVAIDEACNAAATADADISAASANVRTLVITAREDVEIARQVRAALAARDLPERPLSTLECTAAPGEDLWHHDQG